MKIGFCGVNSIEFMRDDVVDICHMPELGNIEVALHDPDPDRLAYAGGLARTIVAQSGSRIQVSACHARTAMLQDADFVVCELEVGGIDAIRRAMAVVRRHGLRESDGTTMGVSGIFRGLRTLPVMLAIAHEMAIHCPRAYLLTYTNPMAMSTWAVRAGASIQRVVGLCHAVEKAHRRIARVLQVDPTDVTVTAAGLNHPSFVLHVRHRGVHVEKWFAAALEQAASIIPPLDAEVFRRFGHLPAGMRADHLPWVMRHAVEVARLRVPLQQYEEEEAEIRTLMAAEGSRIDRGEMLDLSRTGALAARVIRALVTGEPEEAHAIVPNDGLIPCLPADACVEVPCSFGPGGVTPTPMGALPPQIAALNRTIINVVELTVGAVLEAEPRHVHHAAMLDPATAATLSMPQIAAVCDELLADPAVSSPGLTHAKE